MNASARLSWKEPRVAAAAALALLSALLFVLLVSRLPVAILSAAAHDDAWFWSRAQAIVAGDWLGEYDQFTLMKGPGYPLLLALAHGLGLSITTVQASLYALACLLLGHAVYTIGGRPWLSLLLVLAVQWHPSTMEWVRVVRDNVSAAQVLLVLACVLHALWGGGSRRARLCWAAAGGWMLGWFWTTREDGVWLLPGVCLLLLAALAMAWRERARLRGVLGAAAAMAIAAVGWMGLVVVANGVKYGEFVATEFQAAPMADALDALHSVRVGEPVPFVPVPKAVREAVYEASPTFARLQTVLEAPDNFWLRPGCRTYRETCGDYAGGWFMWALRDAAAGAGAHGSAPEAAAFYRRVADEVAGACAAGRLRCERPLLPMMPAVTDAQWRTLPRRLSDAVALLAWRDAAEPPFRSHLEHSANADMWRFIGSPRVPDAREALGNRASGWLHDPAGGWVQGRCGPDGAPVAIERRPSPDVAAHLGDPAHAMSRFSWKLPDDGCRLQLVAGGQELELARLDRTPGGHSLGDANVYLDALDGIPRSAAAASWSLAVKAAVSRGYALGLAWLAIAGLCAFAWALVQALRRRHASPLLALAAAGWGLVACRTLVLLMVDVSAFPAVNVQYMQPAFPLLVVAAVASIGALPGPRRLDAATRR